MNTEGIYNYVKQNLRNEIDDLKQAVLIHEVERYREEIAGHLRHDVQDWIDAVCEQFGTKMEYLISKSRKREYVTPRQIIQWGLVKGVIPNKLSLTAIGGLVNRDHATALHSRKTIDQLLDTDQQLREDIMQIINRFGWRAGYDKSTKSFYMLHSIYTIKVAA